MVLCGLGEEFGGGRDGGAARVTSAVLKAKRKRKSGAFFQKRSAEDAWRESLKFIGRMPGRGVGRKIGRQWRRWRGLHRGRFRWG